MGNKGETLHSKKIVIFAGAGISKEAPSNLFSWWEYNRLIINEIGKIGAGTAGMDGNLLDADEVMQKVPVSTISDFLFNYSAGKAYFPLLKILEGSHPNRNHYLLAQLAECGEIAGIITTNFDTLIEQAFAEHGFPVLTYVCDEDYADFKYKGFPIYKIHGSVTDTDTAIDTAQQKLQGLSAAKKQLLSRIFRENHIIFMGFSGEDFAFDCDYIPLADAKCGITWVLNPAPGKVHCGLQWMEYPRNCEDLSIFVRKNLNHINGFKLCVATISEFCDFMEWKMTEVLEKASLDGIPFSAQHTVREFLIGNAVTEWGCVGMCIELLRTVKGNKKALALALQVDKVLSKWLDSYPGQKAYILLPIIEQTVSDLLTEIIQFGTEQIAELYMLMPLCDTLADTFKLAGMYSKSMKYYYFSLCITHQRFLEHILENDYAKLRKSYNNMATTKMRIGKMLFEMKRYGNASRFLEEAMEDALKAGYFYDISAAYLCRVEMDIAMLQEKDTSQEYMFLYRTFDVQRLYADMWCVIRLAKKAGNSRVLCSVYCHMMVLFTDYKMFSYIPLVLDHIESFAKITPEASRCLEMVEELRKSLPDDIERAEGFPPDLQYHEPQYEVIWEYCRERDILSVKEGQEAYRQVCLGREDEARRVLKEAADQYYQNCLEGDFVTDRENMYLAEMFSYCYIRMEAKHRNTFGIKEAEIYLFRCLKLELSLWQTEYLTETTAYITIYYYENEAFSEALLYAELCLCFSDNPIAHGIILNSCAIAALSCINMDKKPEAAYYAEFYFQLAEQFPEASDASIKEFLLGWLNDSKR